jgi:hypothetical protein
MGASTIFSKGVAGQKRAYKCTIKQFKINIF